MKSLPLAKLNLLFVAPVLVCAASAQEEQVFHERFTNNAGENVNFSDLGWSAMVLDPNGVDPVKAA